MDALFRYNPSVAYGLTVQAWAQAYRTGGAPVIPAQDGAVPEPPPGPAEPSASVLAAPEEAVQPENTAGPAGSAPAEDVVPENGPSPEASGVAGADESADLVTTEPPVSDDPEQEGTAEDPDNDTTAESPGSTPASGPNCDSLVLSVSVAVVVPDARGMLLRFPTDELPDDCAITSATLRLDPGAAAADRTVQVERVADEWSEQTTQTPTTIGDPVTADAGPGERAWSVDALLAALVEGPDRGLLLSIAGDGDPVPLIGDGNARLEIVLGAAQPA